MYPHSILLKVSAIDIVSTFNMFYLQVVFLKFSPIVVVSDLNASLYSEKSMDDDRYESQYN